MYRFIFIVIALIYAKFAFSQFSDTVHHHFSFSATGLINKTKEAISYVLHNSVEYNLNQKKISQNTYAGWIYGKQQHLLSNNDLTINADLDYLKNIQKIYYWALLGFDKSYSLNINYRFQSGAGIGYNLLHTDLARIVLSDGFVYETGSLTDPVLGKDIYQTLRNSVRLKYRWMVKKFLVLEGVHFFQPSISSFKDYILKSESKLTVRLNKWLGINASVTYNKLSRINRENLLITYGLTVDKYF